MIFLTFGFLLIFLTRIEISFSVRGGDVTEQKKFPAQAFMMVEHLVGEPIFCGASILDANHILTAASCVVFNNELISPSKLLVQAGSSDFSEGKANQKVSAIFIHNEFDPVSFKHDIAVIRMEKEKFDDYNTESLKSATLQKDSVPDKTTCQIAGFYFPAGLTLRFLELSIQDRDTCNSDSVYNGKIFNQMLCAGLKDATSERKQGVCPSNRGGGLYCGDRLTGVLSTIGLECGSVRKQRPGVYTEVRSYTDWIEKKLEDKSTPEAGPIRPSNAAAMPVSFSVSLLIGILLINCLISV